MNFNPGIFLCGAIFSLAVSGISLAQTTNAFDTATNYSGGWGSGSNRGTGFGPWSITVSTNTNASAGSFVGNPNDAGITGFGTSAIGLYANPPGSGAFVSVDRSLSNALVVGGTFELKWALNWDTGGGNKGFNIYSGGPGTNQLVNINQGNFPGDITCNDANTLIPYGTGPMTWRFTMVSSNTLRISSTLRDGSTNVVFSTNITVAASPRSFRLYASEMAKDGNQADTDKRQPYFNDFRVTTSAGDLTAPVMSLAPGIGTVVWAAQNTNTNSNTLTLSASDVLATDNSGSASVRVYPGTVTLGTSGFTTLTYIGTDAAGNTASLRRLLTVGNASPGFWNLKTGALTLHTLSTNGPIEGEIYLDGFTAGSGAATGVQAWVGVSSTNTNPASWGASSWTEANYSGEGGNNDVYQGIVVGTNRTPGTYYFATRFRLGTNTSNTNFFYGGIGSDGGSGRWGEVRTNQSVVGGVTNNVAVTNGNGILTVEAGRLVTYTVDMGVYRKLGTFNPSNHTLQVRTGLGLSDYAERGLTNVPGTDLYSGTFPIGGSPGSTNFFKYYWAGTNGLEWEPYAGPTPDRPLVLGANAAAQNAGTNFYGDLAGRRNVTFTVDMSVQKFKGLFNPSLHSLEVRYGFDTAGYAERALTNTTGDLYSGSFFIDGADGSTNRFKFYAVGTNGLSWEGGADREVVLGGTATNQVAGPYYFNNLAESRRLSVSVNMSEQVLKGRFDPGAHAVYVISDLEWGLPGKLMNPAPVLGPYVYALDLPMDGPVPASFQFKFYNNSPLALNDGYEWGQNLSFAQADLAGLANLGTLAYPTVVFRQEIYSGSPYADWSGAAATNGLLVGKYGIGGAASLAAASERPVAVVDSNTLSLTAIVRTNDTKLKVEGEAGGSLTNWSTNGVSNTVAGDQAGVPEGHQRQVFSVDRANSPNRQFLRLKATLQP